MLDRNSDPNLRVYAIWYNMVFSDRKKRWPDELLSDPRVIHFWDEEKVLGRWFGSHPDYLGSNRVYWDAYLLYGPRSRWSEKPDDLVGWGGTIIAKRDELKTNVESTIRKYHRKKR